MREHGRLTGRALSIAACACALTVVALTHSSWFYDCDDAFNGCRSSTAWIESTRPTILVVAAAVAAIALAGVSAWRSSVPLRLLGIAAGASALTAGLAMWLVVVQPAGLVNNSELRSGAVWACAASALLFVLAAIQLNRDVRVRGKWGELTPVALIATGGSVVSAWVAAGGLWSHWWYQYACHNGPCRSSAWIEPWRPSAIVAAAAIATGLVAAGVMRRSIRRVRQARFAIATAAGLVLSLIVLPPQELGSYVHLEIGARLSAGAAFLSAVLALAFGLGSAHGSHPSEDAAPAHSVSP